MIAPEIADTVRAGAGGRQRRRSNRSVRCSCGTIINAKPACFRSLEECARLLRIVCGYEDFDRPQAVERQAVCVAQRFAAFDRRNTCSFQKGANLLRLDFTVRDEYASQLSIHA
jgi:hypothetical protein